MNDDRLSPEQIEAAGLTDWHQADLALHTTFRTGNFATGLRLVNLIGEAAEQADHHPDIDLRYGTVRVLLTTHDSGGITALDVSLAHRISEFARGLGATAEPGS
jgi:4a-hydroxytetrahydrobiopterin dehydratase